MCKINTSTAIGAGQLPATLLQEAIPTGSAHTNMAAGKESHGWLSIPTYHTLGGNQFLLQASSFLQQRFVDCQLLANYQLRTKRFLTIRIQLDAGRTSSAGLPDKYHGTTPGRILMRHEVTRSFLTWYFSSCNCF